MSRADEEGQALGHPKYWNDHYSTATGTQPKHEWFKSFTSLEPFFNRHIFTRKTTSRILHLGSGDSTIPRDLASRGYRNQICVDFSPVVVELMSSQHLDSVEWMQADVRDLVGVADRSVDVAFDKGTLDAMIYGSPWDPPDEVKDNAAAYMNEVFRVLKDDGIFLFVTFRQPHFVKPLMNKNAMWNLDVEILREGEAAFDYHGFVLSKTLELKSSSRNDR